MLLLHEENPDLPGFSPSKYPGINFDLRYIHQHGPLGHDFYRLGSFDGLERTHSPMIMVREVAMMILMNRLTDKPNWDTKVLDDAIVTKWKNEAMSLDETGLWDEILGEKADSVEMPEFQRIISERAFDYCIAELRCKADHFKKTNLIYALNFRDNNIIKSDTSVSLDLHHGLRAAFDRLVQDQAADPDYHPWTDDKVQDLVHPSMYPFVYGKSCFIQDEVVGVEDAIEKWAGKGELSSDPIVNQIVGPQESYDPLGRPEEVWSTKYQWLPANLDFSDDGTVRFTSYINNLHPNKYPEIYRLIEKLIDVAIPAWEGVLTGGAVTQPHNPSPDDRGRGQDHAISRASQSKPLLAERACRENVVPVQRSPSEEANDFEVNVPRSLWPLWKGEMDEEPFQWVPVTQHRFDDPPISNYDEDASPCWEKFDADRLAAYEEEHGEIKPDELEDILDYWHDSNDDTDLSGLSEEEKRAHRTLRVKWRKIRDAQHPEPLDFVPVTFSIEHKLKDKFRDSGLQVIVKMATIQLTPENPDFPIGGWHIEGQLNERIVATALYYLDSENVTSSSLSFRMTTDADEHIDRVMQNMSDPYEQFFGTPLTIAAGGSALQYYGSVETRQGRLLAFPNVMHHRVSPFRLQDSTKPGHRRFIALWLVDPHQRIVSTANVPPQQFDWWAEAVFRGGEGSKGVSKGDLPPEVFQVLLEQGGVDSKNLSVPKEVLQTLHNRLPEEIMDMVRQNRALPDGIMSAEEARQHRLALMAERSAFQDASEKDWHHRMRDYSFCEH